METCVLIPQEFSLAINALTNNNETDLTVWTCSDIPKGQLFYPFQGTIRIDKLNVASSLQDDDIRYQFGLYDEIATMLGKEVHHCNWIRFLRISNTFDSNVNMVCTKLKGEPIYETIKMIANNQELVVFYLPQRPEQHLFSEMRTSLYRHAIDSILQDTPLDLSTSLIHREVLPVSPASTSEDEHKSTSSESFGSITSLHVVENLVTSNGNKNLSCSLKTQTPRKSTRVSRGERSLLPCSVCGKTFDRPSLLKRHMRTHTGEKPHVCVVCGKGFSTSSSLNTHRRIHSGEKPHECQVCGKRFTASSNLYYHRMTHIKEKPHKCNLCSKSFPTPGDLKSHMYVHSGSWPFKCHICFRGFSKQTNLKNHLFLHTGDKPHICELCNKKFALACNLRAHLKTHEGEQQDECVRCGKVYLAAVNAKQKGICLRCFESNKLIDVTKTGFQYDVELATEDDSSNDSNELSDK